MNLLAVLSLFLSILCTSFLWSPLAFSVLLEADLKVKNLVCSADEMQDTAGHCCVLALWRYVKKWAFSGVVDVCGSPTH